MQQSKDSGAVNLLRYGRSCGPRGSPGAPGRSKGGPRGVPGASPSGPRRSQEAQGLPPTLTPTHQLCKCAPLHGIVFVSMKKNPRKYHRQIAKLKYTKWISDKCNINAICLRSLRRQAHRGERTLYLFCMCLVFIVYVQAWHASGIFKLIDKTLFCVVGQIFTKLVCCGCRFILHQLNQWNTAMNIQVYIYTCTHTKTFIYIRICHVCECLYIST